MSAGYLVTMSIAGLPLHPLVIHAVVVLAPLAALAALAFALFPRWRWLLRWPMVVLTVVAFVSAYVATVSGEDLAEARGLDQLPAVQTHEERGELARNVLFGFTVLVGLAAWRLGGTSPLASRRGERTQRGGALDITLTVLLAIGAVGALAAVVLAGDSGARAVWGS